MFLQLKWTYHILNNFRHAFKSSCIFRKNLSWELHDVNIRSTWDPKTFDWELLDVIRCHFMIQDFHCGLNNNLQTLLCKQVLLLKRLYSFKRKLLFLLLMKILRTTSLFANSFHILHIFGKNKVLYMFVYL